MAYTLDAPKGEAVLEESRVLNAPRTLVWKAMTDPCYLAQWWGPHGYTNPICELDVRPGGKWRVHQRNPAGEVFKFHGEFVEVEAPSRMVQTFAFADYPPARVEFHFEEIDGRTHLRSTMRFETVAMRDAMIASGMEKGARESYERLDVVLDKLKLAAPRTGYAGVNGIELYYAIHGDGKPLILLHGGYGTGESFAPILPQLAAGRQVIAIDLQAHGRTADIDRAMTCEAMADDIAALIGHLGLGRPDIMGYSLGGCVALNVAIRHPDLVGRLVLVSTPHKRTAWYPAVLAAMASSNNAAFAESMKGSPMHLAYAAVAPRPDDFGRLASRIGTLLATPYDWSEGIRQLHLPVLLVFGDSDGMPPQQAAEFFSLLGGGQRDAGWDGSGMIASRLAILPAMSHYDIGTAPALLPPVLDFLGATLRS